MGERVMLTEAILGAVTEAAFGYLLEEAGVAETVRAWLGRDLQRLAFQVALSRAYSTFARRHPQWAASLFDEHFLARGAAPFLAGCLTRNKSADPAEMAAAWADQLGPDDHTRRQRIGELTPVAADFLGWFKAELRARREFQPLFDSRALDAIADATTQTAQALESLKAELQQAQAGAEKYAIVVEKGQGLVIGDKATVTNIFNTYFDGDFATLEELYLAPDEVFERVRLEDFTGRQWLKADLDAFLHDPGRDRGAWLLVGEAGVGKTTFLAHLVQERGYLHFFCELAPGDANLPRTIQSLAAQLVTRFRLEPYASRDALPQPLLQYPDFLVRLLCMAAGKLNAGEQLVIVVDALDEAGTTPSGNPIALPRRLPQGVYLILSQRPQPIALSIEPMPRRVDLRAEGGANRRDVETYLKQVARTPAISGQLRAHNYVPDDFVRILGRKSSGNWMYLAYVIEEIRQGVRAPLDLETLPAGLVGYYAQYWSRWRDKPGWDRLYAPVLAVLAAAREPLTAERLQTWAGTEVDVYRMRRLLREDWRAFIYELKEVVPRYRPYHITLREFLSGAVPSDQFPPGYAVLLEEMADRTLAAHKRIVDCLKKSCDGDWPKLIDDSYARRYLTTHLCDAAERETLFAVVDDEAWYQAQEAQDASRTAYLNDLAQARSAAETANESAVERGEPPSVLGREIRYALASASLHTLAGNVPPALIIALVQKGLWSPEQALEVAWQNPKAETRAEAIEALAPYLPDFLLVKALAMVRDLGSESYRIEAEVELISYLPESQRDGALQDALAILPSISAPPERLAKLASRLPESLQEQVFRKVLETTTGPHYQVPLGPTPLDAISQLMPHLPEQWLEDTLVVVRELEAQETERSGDPVARVLVELVVRLAELDHTRRAMETTLEIKSSVELADALGRLVSCLTERQLSEALLAAQQIDEHSLVQVLSALAPHLSKGILRKALAIAGEIRGQTDRVKALAGLAPHLSGREREKALGQALATIENIGDDEDQANALEKIAPYLSRQMLQQSLDLARTIHTESAQAWALAWLIPHLSPSEQERELREALLKSRTIEDEEEWAWMVEWLATHLPESFLPKLAAGLSNRAWQNFRVEADLRLVLALHLSGQEQEEMLLSALDAAHAIEDGEEKDGVLAGLAVQLFKLGRIDEGIAVTRTIRYADDISGILVNVASFLPQNALAEALNIARDIPFPEPKAQALAGLAPYLEEPLLRSALTAAQETGCIPNRAQALAGLSPYLGGSLLREVLSEVQEIAWEPSRSQALSELLPRLAETGHPMEALEATRSIGVARSRVQAISRILPYLTEPHLERAAAEGLKALQAVEDEEELVETLVALAPQLPKSLLPEVLDIVKRLYWDWDVAAALEGLAPYLSESLLREALAMALMISEEEESTKALEGLAPYMSEPLLRKAMEEGQAGHEESSRSHRIGGLIPRLAELGYSDQALALVQAIQDEGDRMNALSRLAPYLSNPFLEMALSTAQGMEHSLYRSRAQAAIVCQLARLGHLDEAEALAERTSKDWPQVAALTNLLPDSQETFLVEALSVVNAVDQRSLHIPILHWQTMLRFALCLPEYEQKCVVQKILESTRSTQIQGVERDRVRAFSHLAPYLDETERVQALREALETVEKIGDEGHRASAFEDLAPSLANLPATALYPLWRQIMRSPVNLTCQSLLGSLRALIPVIFHLGGEQAIEDTFRAIQWAGKQWL